MLKRPNWRMLLHHIQQADAIGFVSREHGAIPEPLSLLWLRFACAGAPFHRSIMRMRFQMIFRARTAKEMNNPFRPISSFRHSFTSFVP